MHLSNNWAGKMRISTHFLTFSTTHQKRTIQVCKHSKQHYRHQQHLQKLVLSVYIPIISFKNWQYLLKLNIKKRSFFHLNDCLFGTYKRAIISINITIEQILIVIAAFGKYVLYFHFWLVQFLKNLEFSTFSQIGSQDQKIFKF